MGAKKRKSKNGDVEEIAEDAIVHCAIPRGQCSAMLGYMKYQLTAKNNDPGEKLAYKKALEAGGLKFLGGSGLQTNKTFVVCVVCFYLFNMS